MDLIFIAAILLIAAVVQGSIGFSFGLIAIPLLSSFMHIQDAAITSLVMSSVVTLSLILRNKHTIHFSRFRWFWFSIIIGALLPLFIHITLNEGQLGLLLSVLVIVLAALTVFKSLFTLNNGFMSQTSFGFLSGFINSIIGTNGPLLATYFEANKFKHKEFIGTLSVLLLTANIISIGVISTNISDYYLSPINLVLFAVVVLIGSTFASRITDNINESVFKHIVIATVVLIASHRLYDLFVI